MAFNHAIPRSYADADKLLQGRCRHRRKLANNTYLLRTHPWSAPDEAIAVRLHFTNIVTFYKDGRIALNTGGWNTVTTRGRMNQYIPQTYSVGSERNTCFLYKRSEVAVKSKWDETYSYYPHEKHCVIEDSVTIQPDGSVENGGSVKEVLDRWKEEDKERARLRYWVRKARLVNAGRAKPSPKMKVSDVMDEENISIRTAKMGAYGLDRFLLDAGAKAVDVAHGYELLDFKLNAWNNIRALKMRCPSTAAVYVSPVAPHVRSVPEALDWYFNTENYLGQITQQS